MKSMLIYSMSVSVDGFIADREGAFEWTAPSDELFRFHITQTRELGGFLLGRRLYETMLVWETDPSMRDSELDAAFADVWCAIPKVVFSRTLDSVQGNARLAEASLAEEAAAALDLEWNLSCPSDACDLRVPRVSPPKAGGCPKGKPRDMRGFPWVAGARFVSRYHRTRISETSRHPN